MRKRKARDDDEEQKEDKCEGGMPWEQVMKEAAALGGANNTVGQRLLILLHMNLKSY